MDAQVSNTEGVKVDAGKPRLDMVPPAGIVAVGEVMTYGATKYGDHNYRLGMRHGRLIAAALRHITAYNGGEDNDVETGLSHVSHASACLLMLCQVLKDYPELDDRFHKPIKEVVHGVNVAEGHPVGCGVCVAGGSGIHHSGTLTEVESSAYRYNDHLDALHR